MRILIIEDEEKLAQSIKKSLEKESFSVDYVLDGESGERRIQLYQKDYDLIILDLGLPNKNGMDICKSVREQGIVIPILMLTGKDAMNEKVLGLEAGADDYLVKPFAIEELVARVKALLRRPKESLPQKLKVGDIVLDPVTRQVSLHDKDIIFTLKEYELLEYLMRNKNRVVDREQIFSHVWDFAVDSFSNVVDVHIKNVRKKLGEHANGKLLETIRGVGYKLTE